MLQQRFPEAFVNQLKNILINERIETIEDVAFSNSMGKKLLYPTNDLLLYEHQFSTLVSCLDSSENLYIFQVSNNGKWDDQHDLFQISAPFSYSEYNSLYFYNPTIMFSDSFSWALVIDESLEGGIGILAGNFEFIRRYEERVPCSDKDLIKCVQFYLIDAEKRNTGYQHLKNILSKLI